MLARHARWLAVLTSVLTSAVLAANDAPAQAPQATPPPPGIVPAPVADRLNTLVSPTETAVSDGQGGGSPVGDTRAGDRTYGLIAGWSDGLRFRSADDAFHLHVGGNAQLDSSWLIGPNGAFALPNGSTSGIGNDAATFLRRARFRLEGDIFDQFDYILEYDFAHAQNENNGLQPPSFDNITGSPVPLNVWLQVRDVPALGNVRIGNQVKPIGFTNQVYQGFLPFMERADNQDAFYAPFDSGFALGVTARNHTDDERITWQYGIYRPMINQSGVALNKMELGGRVTGLPVYEDGGRVLVHMGLGTLGGELVQNQLRVRARPVLRNGPGYAVPVLADTGHVPGSRQYTLAPEFAAVLGSWTFQSEWTGQFLTQATPSGKTNQGTVLYHGGYAQVLYFLTGEHQSYDKAAGAFGRVVPNRNLRMKRGEGVSGWGAWQVGVRFSYLDLNDKAIQGGTIYNWTAGLNWFWNPNMKVQFNYILERRDQPGVTPAWINGVGVRAAYDF